MKRLPFDIDIDVQSSFDKRSYGKPIPIYDEERKRITGHPSGVLIGDDTPDLDPVSGLVPIDYKELDDLGFVKVDLLSNTAYDSYHSKAEIYSLLEREDEIPWHKLRSKEYVDSLPHVRGNYLYVSELEPKSIEDLADLLALIRPGKSELIPRYIKEKEVVRKSLYKRPSNGQMFFKKSQAIAYATMVCLLMLKREPPKFFKMR